MRIERDAVLHTGRSDGRADREKAGELLRVTTGVRYNMTLQDGRAGASCSALAPLRKLQDRREGIADARGLGSGDHAAEDLAEARLLDARDDVLPAIGGKNARLEPAPLSAESARPQTSTK